MKGYFFKKYKEIKRDITLKKYSKYINIDENTVLLPEFNVDIRDEQRSDDNILKIGKECMVACDIIFEKDTGKVVIGDRTNIGNDTKIISINSIEIGADVTISWGCTIYDHNSHSVYWNERKNDNIRCLKDYIASGNSIKSKEWNNVKSKAIKIEDKVWIGFDCVILKGVTIGEGAVVGARSVVTRDVPPYTVVAGNPARVVKRLERG